MARQLLLARPGKLPVKSAIIQIQGNNKGDRDVVATAKGRQTSVPFAVGQQQMSLKGESTEP